MIEILDRIEKRFHDWEEFGYDLRKAELCFAAGMYDRGRSISVQRIKEMPEWAEDSRAKPKAGRSSGAERHG